MGVHSIFQQSVVKSSLLFLINMIYFIKEIPFFLYTQIEGYHFCYIWYILHQNRCTSWVFILFFNDPLLNQVFCFWYIWYTSSKRYHFSYIHKLRDTIFVTYNILCQNGCTSWVFILFFNDLLLNQVFYFWQFFDKSHL